MLCTFTEVYTFSCGDCPAGYTGDGKTCSDVDECTGNVCDHICLNSPGSYVCVCRSGYELNTDASTCDGMYSFKFLSIWSLRPSQYVISLFIIAI